MTNYIELPKEYDFNTKFPTWIIAFCPDTNSWFVTNQRFFYYEYEKEFVTEEEGIAFFKENPNIFYNKEIEMKVYRPYNGVVLDNTNEFIELKPITLPDCPICKTNKYMSLILDCSTHAGNFNDNLVYHSDLFKCSCCSGHIHYSTESTPEEIFSLEINYRKQDYQPCVRKIK